MSEAQVQQLVRDIEALVAEIDQPIPLMEVCGTHTVSLFRSGVRGMLPDGLRLLSGPGCPVCVTAQSYIDAACALASRPEVIVCSYGDMLRVPGQGGSLAERRAQGARVQVVFSIRDALRLAEENPDSQVVFLAVGFETTTPATAAGLRAARQRGLQNFSVLPGHKLVVPAMQALLADPEIAVRGFLCPGHVAVIIGAEAFRPIVEQYRKPCVVAGFEPTQMLMGIREILQMLRDQDPQLGNVYPAAVQPGGNPQAMRLIDEVLEPASAPWRALGEIPGSGLALREDYREFDATQRFDIDFGDDQDPPGCRCGEVIQGKTEPHECGLFGNECTPRNPVGPCMVSSEGSCAAHYKYARPQTASSPA